MPDFPRVLKFSYHNVRLSMLSCVVQPWQLVTDHQRPGFALLSPYREKMSGKERSDAATKRSAVVPALTCQPDPVTFPLAAAKSQSPGHRKQNSRSIARSRNPVIGGNRKVLLSENKNGLCKCGFSQAKCFSRERLTHAVQDDRLPAQV